MKNMVTENFSEEELACRCGKCLFYIDETFIRRLQNVRNNYGKPMVINSGYRCPAHNKRIGGHHSSQHVLGRAADIRVESEQDKNLLIRIARQEKMTGIGVGKNYVHLDSKPGKFRTWSYT